MASSYARPELSTADLRAFRDAKCVMVNPAQADVIKALTTTQKGCRYNFLSQEEALAVYDRFIAVNPTQFSRLQSLTIHVI